MVKLSKEDILSNFNNATQELKLTNRNVEEIENDTLNIEEIKGVKSLDLSKNQIEKIYNQSFYNLHDLNILSLSNNKIKYLAEDLFKNSSNLKTLSLNENSINAIQRKTLEPLKVLESLDLSKNEIDYLGEKTFKPYSSSFRNFAANISDKVEISSKLKVIKLTENNLTKLHEDNFKGLSNLIELDLSGNKVVFDCDTFKYLSNLKNLNLSNNEITTINDKSFKDLSNLTDLNLSNNEITTINDKSFKDLSNLKNLNLSNNEITTINDKSFKDLSNLETLDLSENLISLSDQISGKTSKDISRNNSSDLADFQNPSEIEQKGSKFSKLKNLKKLNLRKNKIDRIDSDCFIDMENLENLIISSNYLKQFDAGYLKNSKKIQSIDLSYNEISKINFSANNDKHAMGVFIGSVFGSSSNLTNLKTLKLHKNKIQNLDGLSSLTSLEVLTLDYNDLSNKDKLIYPKHFEEFQHKKMSECEKYAKLDPSKNFFESFENLFVEQSFKVFCIIEKESEKKLQDFVDGLYNNIEPRKLNDKIVELNELIKIAIRKSNPKVVDTLLAQLILLKSENFSSMEATIQEIQKENYILIAAQTNTSDEILDVLKSRKLDEFNKESDCFEAIGETVKNNNPKFLEKILKKLITPNDDSQNEESLKEKWITSETINLSVKSQDCFKVLYNLDTTKSRFSNSILMYCLKYDEHIDVFLWLIDQFIDFIDTKNYRDKAFVMIRNNIKNNSIFSTILEKCRDNLFFENHGKLILERVFSVEAKISKNVIKDLPHSLFFPSNSDAQSLKTIENECLEYILKGNLLNVVEHIFSYFNAIQYRYLKEFLKSFCDQLLLNSQTSDMFFKILEQINNPELSEILDYLLNKIVDPCYKKFFDSLFKNETPAFFQTYKRHTDQRNILHFSALISDEINFEILSQKYKKLLDEKDNLEQSPIDLLIQRVERITYPNFVFSTKFIKDLINKIYSDDELINLSQETLISICKRNDVIFLKEVIYPQSRYKFSANHQLQESSLDIILQNKSSFSTEIFYQNKFIISEIIDNPNFTPPYLTDQSFFNLFQRDDSTLLKLIEKYEFQPKITQERFNACVKLAAANVECFKVVFEFDKVKTMNAEDIFKFCLDYAHMDTFLFLLGQFEILISQIDFNSFKSLADNILLSLFYKGIKHQFSTEFSILSVFIRKMNYKLASYQENSKKSLEKMLQIEALLSSYRSTLLGHSLFFPSDLDRSVVRIYEKSCLNLILEGKYTHVIFSFMSYLKNIRYKYFDEFLQVFCDLAFKKKAHIFFFDALDSFNAMGVESLFDFDKKLYQIFKYPKEIEDSFKYLKNFTKLEIVNTRINILYENVFHCLSSLDTLILSFNDILVIRKNPLNGLNNLKRLKFVNNSFSGCKKFNNYPKELPRENYKNFITSVISGLINLEYLNMSQNEINFRPDFSLIKLPKLKTLVLANNSIKYISPKLFRELPTLESLDISDNGIGSIDEGAFTELSMLKNLVVSKNFIYHFKIDIHLVNSNQIEFIDLSENPINLLTFPLKNLSAKFFRFKFPNLKVLKLFGANIKKLSSLNYFQKLEVLKLDYYDIMKSTNFESIVSDDFKKTQMNIFDTLKRQLMLNVQNMVEIFKLSEFQKSLKVLSVENLYKIFELVIERGDATFQSFVSEFYTDRYLSLKINETCSDLKEIIWMAIINNNSAVFRHVLILIDYLHLETPDLKKMLLLTSECDLKGDLYAILHSLNMTQLNDEDLSESFVIVLKNAVEKNNRDFLKSFLSNLKYETRETLIDEKLTKIAAKNLECFKVIYEFDKSKSCFGEDILEYCLSKEFMATFLWLLNKLKFLIDEKMYDDNSYIMISKCIKRKSATQESIFNIFLSKCANQVSFTSMYAKVILEKVFEIEAKVCLFFPYTRERPFLLKIENACIDLILDGMFVGLIEPIFTYLGLVPYPYIEECLINLCEKMFEKKVSVVFFKILHQLKKFNLEFVLDNALKTIFDPIHKRFFTDVFSFKESGEFFLTYKRHIDGKNILHLAAELSDESHFTILAQKYNNLLNGRDNDKNLPLDILINRHDNVGLNFVFSINFLSDILEKTKRISSNDKIELAQESLNSICQRNDKDFLKKFIQTQSRVQFRSNENLEQSPLDIIVQSKSSITSQHGSLYFYETKFIQEEILKSACFSHCFLNSQSFECLFLRNDRVIFKELVILKYCRPTMLYRKQIEACIEIMVSNQNEEISKLLTTYLNNSFYTSDKILIFDLINFGLNNSIKKEFFAFANNLLFNALNYFNGSDFLLMADLVIKNVLIKKCYDANHFNYLDQIFKDHELEKVFDLIDLNGRTPEQNILHFVAETCEFEVFEYFFSKYKDKVSLIDDEKLSPLDILIQKIEENKLDSFYKKIIKSYVNEKNSNNLNLRHRSFVTLCKLVTRDHLSLIAELIIKRENKFNTKFNKGFDQTDENSSLSDFILRRDHSRDIWIFQDDFIYTHLKNLIDYHSFGDYKLSHDSFEALCRRNNRDLMKTVTQNTNLKFNHKSDHTFDNCFKLIIANRSKDNIAEELLDYLKVFFKEDFFTTLIYYIVKYIDKSVTEFNNQEFALFLITHLNKFGESENEIEFFKIVKDSLIKSILKVEAFHALVKSLLDKLDFLEKFIKLDKNENENILHFAAYNCDSEKILALFEHFIINSEYLHEPNKKGQTPLDILIQKRNKKQPIRTSSDFLETFVNTLKPNDINPNLDGFVDSKIKSLIQKFNIPPVVKQECHDENNGSSYLTFCFSSKSLKKLLDEQTKKSPDFKISFDSFKAICERNDFTRDRNYLIEFFVGKIKKSKDKPSIEESPMHFLLTKRDPDGNFFFTDLNLRSLLENQSVDFSFLINIESFKELGFRKDLNLFKLTIEKAEFDEIGKENDSQTPLDLLIQEKHDKEYVYSNQFIRNIKKSKIYNFQFHQKSLDCLCERNDADLILIIEDRAKGLVRNNDVNSFDTCIQKTIEKNNREISKIVFDFIRPKLAKCTNELCSSQELFEKIKFSINESIKVENNKLRMADSALEYVENVIRDGCDEKMCTCLLFKEAMSHNGFMEHLLEEKRVSDIFRKSVEKNLQNDENILHHAATVCQFKIFISLFNISEFKQLINKSGGENSLTPLDLIVCKYFKEQTTHNDSMRLFKELIFKLPIDLRLKMTQESFEILCNKMSNYGDQSILLTLIEKTDFDKTEQTSPIDVLMKNKSYENTFIKQINQNAQIYTFELNSDTFKFLCHRNDSDLFKQIVSRCKFKGNLFKLTNNEENAKLLTECVEDFVSGEKMMWPNDELSYKLIECFLDYTFQAEATFKNTKLLFFILNYLFRHSIEKNNFRLAEFVLDYFNIRVHEDPYPYDGKINESLVDHATFKILNDKKAWKMIEKILDCSNLSKDSIENYCFSYLDYKVETTKSTTQDNNNLNSNDDANIDDQNLDEVQSKKPSQFYPSTILINSNLNTIERVSSQESTQFISTQTNNQIRTTSHTSIRLENDEKIPINEKSQHPLIWFAESDQKSLKDHPTTLKLLKLKWQKYPLYYYRLITLIQFIYLLTFTLNVYEGFVNDDEKKILSGYRIEGKLLVILIVTVFWILFTWFYLPGIKVFFSNKKNFTRKESIFLIWLARASWLTFTGFLIFGFVSVFKDDSCFLLFWFLNLIFWFLNLVYEGFQIKHSKRKYLNSGKNMLEITNLITNIIILFALLDQKDFKNKAFLLSEDKNKSLLFELVYTFSSTFLLIRYITFLLCLEKMGKVGIYIVAFRKAFNKSLNLAPIILILFTGFTISYKLNKIAPDQNFVNGTVLESVSQISRMFLANIEDLDKMGITNDIGKSISNSINFILFVIMVPILLINLLIGVSTGELTNILDASDLTQYQMRLGFILWLQSFMLDWKGDEWCREKILFTKFTPSSDRKVDKKALAFIKKTDQNYEKDLARLLKKQFYVLSENLLQHTREIDAKITQQNDKIQTLQDGILERINQNEKKYERQLKEFVENSNQKLSSISSDIINK